MLSRRVLRSLPARPGLEDGGDLKILAWGLNEQGCARLAGMKQFSIAVYYPGTLSAVSRMLLDPGFLRSRLEALGSGKVKLRRADLGIPTLCALKETGEGFSPSSPLLQIISDFELDLTDLDLPAKFRSMLPNPLKAHLSETWPTGNLELKLTRVPLKFAAHQYLQEVPAAKGRGSANRGAMVKRVLAGSFALKVPLVGPSIETRILEELPSVAYHEEEIAQAWLQSHS